MWVSIGELSLPLDRIVATSTGPQLPGKSKQSRASLRCSVLIPPWIMVGDHAGFAQQVGVEAELGVNVKRPHV